MIVPEYKFRLATKDDEPFLFEMLYQSLFVEEGQLPFPREMLNAPEIARYVKNWGREGDLGIIAETVENNQPIGAAWCRLFKSNDHGFGYIDDKTLELGIALLPEHRGKGIGTDLMKCLLAEAKKHYSAICLSVSSNNPAIRIYERLGFETVEIRDGSPVMRLNL